MKRQWKIVFIIVFFAVCLIPSAGLLLSGPAEPAANEVPVTLPKIKNYDGTWNSSYFSGLRDYVGKGFFLRLEGITGWNTLSSGLFHSSGNEDVLIGPDDWLFFGGARNDISGAGQMTDREIWCAARSLYLMQEYAESQGAEFLFTIPCGKYTLYPDHAPRYIKVAEGSNRTRLMKSMEKFDVHYADLYEAFTTEDEILYWKWDSHWNARGAALAADVILEQMQEDGNYFEKDYTEEMDHTGDLYAMLYPTGTKKEADYTPVEPLSFEHTSNFHSYDDMTITTESGGTGSLLMFRDSSGRNLYPYLADHFGKALFSRLNAYDLTLIKQQQADHVVIELAERTLNYLLKYPAVYPAPTRSESVLASASAVTCKPVEDPNGSQVEGFKKITGELPAVETESAVYLFTGITLYEAIPGESSFTAYIPDDVSIEQLQVYIGDI